MNEDELWSQLTTIFRDVFGDDEIVLKPEMTAEDIEEWDSLTNVQLFVALEQAFDGLRFSTGEIANLNNVGELHAAIQRRLDS